MTLLYSEHYRVFYYNGRILEVIEKQVRVSLNGLGWWVASHASSYYTHTTHQGEEIVCAPILTKLGTA